MPDPTPDPVTPRVQRVGAVALGAGIGITGLKLFIYFMTASVAVLSDALESIVNIIAAGTMLYAVWLSDRPADPEHPYGHGRAQTLAVGVEGWLILFAGMVIAVEAVGRLLRPEPVQRLDAAVWWIGGVSVLTLLLGLYVHQRGKALHSEPLQADGRHLLVDAVSTVVVLVGLSLVRVTGWGWLDPALAVTVAVLVIATSWQLLWRTFQNLMDRADPEDDRVIREILDEEIRSRAIHGYHKVRHRHTGRFHWVDLHLQVEPDWSVTQGHETATRIEHRIETALGAANATAHVEPSDEKLPRRGAAG